MDTRPSQDPTAEWKTYSDSQYHFSFRYPPTWTIAEDQRPTISDKEVWLSFRATTGLTNESGEPEWGEFTIVVCPNPNKLDLTDWISENLHPENDPNFQTSPPDTKFAGVSEALKVVATGGEFWLIRGKEYVYEFAFDYQVATFPIWEGGALIPSTLSVSN